MNELCQHFKCEYIFHPLIGTSFDEKLIAWEWTYEWNHFHPYYQQCILNQQKQESKPTLDSWAKDETDTASVVIYHTKENPTHGLSYQILCHRRSKTAKSYPGTIGGPAGHCEVKEIFWETICRETLEETGIDIQSYKSMAVPIESFRTRKGRSHLTAAIEVPRYISNHTFPTTLSAMDDSFTTNWNRHQWIDLEDLIGDHMELWLLHPAFLNTLQLFKKQVVREKKEG